MRPNRRMAVEELAEPAIDQSHGSGVGAPQPEQLRFAQDVAHRPGRDVDQRRHFFERRSPRRRLHQVVRSQSPSSPSSNSSGSTRHVLVAIRLGASHGPCGLKRSSQSRNGPAECRRRSSQSIAVRTVRATPVFSSRSVASTVRLRRIAPIDSSITRDRDRLPRVGAGRARPRAARDERADRRRNERVVSLAANPDHLVEPAAISQADLAQQGDVGDQGRG